MLKDGLSSCISGEVPYSVHREISDMKCTIPNLNYWCTRKIWGHVSPVVPAPGSAAPGQDNDGDEYRTKLQSFIRDSNLPLQKSASQKQTLLYCSISRLMLLRSALTPAPLTWPKFALTFWFFWSVQPLSCEPGAHRRNTTAHSLLMPWLHVKWNYFKIIIAANNNNNKSAQSNLGRGPRCGSCARRWVA